MTTPVMTNFPVAHYAFDGSILVEKYDLLYHTGDDVKPASSQADAGSQTANQKVFAQKFAGLALDYRSTSEGAVAKFPVCPDCTIEMDCDSNTFEVGDYVTVIEASSGTALEDQKLTKTTDPTIAIGKVVVREANAATRVTVRLQSRVMTAFDGPVILGATAQSLSGAGALTVTEYLTKWTTTGAEAGTLANGQFRNQLKKIQLIVDGGDGTLTPASLSGGTTITFADAGDFVLLLWNGTAWVVIEAGNDADGATAPAIA